MPPPGGLAAASILWNQTAGFSGNNDLSEITHQPVHFLALSLFAIFDLIIRLNLARFRPKNEENEKEAENGLQARSCGNLSSSVSQGGYSATSGTHADCFTAIYSSLELPFATKLFNFTLMKKW